MDGWMDGWMDGLMDGYIDRHKNDWIDRYFGNTDEAPETSLLGRLCITLFNPRDKVQESSSFSILNRLSSILGTF